MSKEPVKSGKYTFDLSDGLQREDFFAIFVSIWTSIKLIFKLIFYPYVWILRMFGRSIRFVRTKDASEKPLNEDERSFMESIPTFFVLLGFFMGLLLGVVVAIGASEKINAFFESLSLDVIVESIAWWIMVFLEIILTIIGLGHHDIDFLVWNAGDERAMGIIDIIRGFFTIIQDIVSKDPLLLFLAIGAIGITIAIIWIGVSETGIVSRILKITGSSIKFLVSAPYRVFDTVNQIYLSTNSKLASIVIGTDRLENRTVAYHRKILLYALGLGVWTFFGGIFVLTAEIAPSDPAQQIAFFLIVLFVFGVGVGILELFLIVRFLDSVARGKYNILTGKAKE